MKKIMFNDAYGLTDAVLSGRKTQTRRIEFDEYLQTEASDADAIGYGQGCCEMWWNGQILHQIPSRYKVGEVVAVAQNYKDAGYNKGYYRDEDKYIPIYKSDNNNDIAVSPAGWTNKMFVEADLMPHRIRITDICVERLQAISDEDCIKEGLEWQHCTRAFYAPSNRETDPRIWLGNTPREAFATLIDKVSGKGTWESNPYVFAYEFELVK